MKFRPVWCNYKLYYMASSVSGQDESNPALWLATRAGKMELVCPLGTTRRVPRDKFPRKLYNKSFFDQACLVKMAGYWPRFLFLFLFLFFFLLRVYGPRLRLGPWTRKKSSNLANIQPSWPHTWSITHTYCLMHVLVWSTQAESVLSILTLNDVWNASKVLCMILYFIPRDITRVTVESRAL